MAKKIVARQYPRDVWVLSPAYVVKQVTVVKAAWTYAGKDYGDETADQKRYLPEQMHETKQGAIDYGRKQIAAREEYLEKQHALLDARRIKLDKAEQK